MSNENELIKSNREQLANSLDPIISRRGFIYVEELCEYLGWSVSKIRRMMANPEVQFPKNKYLGRRKIWSFAQVEKWKEEYVLAMFNDEVTAA